MADKKHILIVEDDEDISMIEEAYLQTAGYETVVVDDGMKVEEAIDNHKFDLILLDLMLPGKSGYDVCKDIRNKVDIPILMVTARTQSFDKIKGLGLGADDYITKPFDPAELVARVSSNIRQYLRGRGQKENEIIIQDLKIEPDNWKVYKNGKEIKLPNREFELLKFLAENPNIVFSKEDLFEKIWGYEYMSDSATVMVHINRLREKN